MFLNIVWRAQSKCLLYYVTLIVQEQWHYGCLNIRLVIIFACHDMAVFSYSSHGDFQ